MQLVKHRVTLIKCRDTNKVWRKKEYWIKFPVQSSTSICKMRCGFWILLIIHYLNHIHYLIRKSMKSICVPANGRYIIKKTGKTAWNHRLKTTRRYAQRYRRFGNLQMMSNKWQLIIADAVDHLSKASLLKNV